MKMRDLHAGEYGFLLLTSNLGNPGRKPLTGPQFRELMTRYDRLDYQDGSRDMEVQDFLSLGYSPRFSRHIMDLLQEEELLAWYLRQAEKWGITPITRASVAYPVAIRKRLGAESPGVLWARGDLGLLDTPKVSLVGSRELRHENRMFAEEVGRQAALQGVTLVSGNARGADKAAQNACLEAGGQVISIVADSLLNHSPRKNMLFLSENSFDEEFSSQRALSRNRCIHALGEMVLVAQSDLHKGGTWDGTSKNLRYGWSSVACFRDGSEASRELEQMGAMLIGMDTLKDFGNLTEKNCSFL